MFVLSWKDTAPLTEMIIHFRGTNWVYLDVLSFSAGVGDFTGTNGSISRKLDVNLPHVQSFVFQTCEIG